MSKPTVLLIDDDESILTVLSMRLRAGGYQVVAATDGDSAVAALAGGRVDVALSDLRLEREDGLAVMERLHQLDASLPVLILTAHGSIPNAVDAMNRGAAGYLTKPVNREELFAQLSRCLAARRLSAEVDLLRRAIEDREELEGMVGRSAGMRLVFEQIERTAPTRLPVLLLGEPGTGKERAARAMHRLSPRANRPFLVMSCAGLSATTALELLVGRVDGNEGRLLAAHEGTLFLDNLGELPLMAQRALLGALRQGEITPVGRSAPIRVDTRVIAASAAGLSEAAAAGRLLEGLLDRFQGATLHLPPLREREGDVTLLAERLLTALLAREGGRVARLGADAISALNGYTWPGNVRELESALERALALCDGETIGARHLFPEAREGTRRPGRAYEEARAIWERGYLEDLLRAADGDLPRASRESGLGLEQLQERLSVHALLPGARRSS